MPARQFPSARPAIADRAVGLSTSSSCRWSSRASGAARANEALLEDVAVEAAEGGWRVTLDGRPIRTQGGEPQLVPTQALAEALADEWRAQGERIDPDAFPCATSPTTRSTSVRPTAPRRSPTCSRYAETDTLCYRADPDEPLYRRQQELWEPLVAAFAARHGVRLEPVCGIVHRPQPEATMARLRRGARRARRLHARRAATLAPLAASLTVALAALAGADPRRCSPPPTASRTGRPSCGAGISRPNAPARRLAAFEARWNSRGWRGRCSLLPGLFPGGEAQPTQSATSPATWLAAWLSAGPTEAASAPPPARGSRSGGSARCRRASAAPRRSAPPRCRWRRRSPCRAVGRRAWSPPRSRGRPRDDEPGALARIVSASRCWNSRGGLFDPQSRPAGRRRSWRRSAPARA